jgi:hypothetical protein
MNSKDVKEMLDPKTTGTKWRWIRDICGSIGLGGAAIASILADGKAKVIVGAISGVLLAVGGYAHTDRSRKPLINK